MWKLWHKLFGFHYLAVKTHNQTIISRLRFTTTGDPYVILFCSPVFLKSLPHHHPTWEIIPMTFKKEDL